VVNQDKLAVIEAGDTALVIAKAVLKAGLKEKSDFSMERIATYVFRKEAGAWRCVVDNSYGAELLEA
jgi:ketosteroid isomerase-like protein